MPPTPAHPFFLRRKDAKTYPRGSVLLDISSGGSIPRSNRKRSRAPIYHKTTVVLLGKSRGAGQCFSFTGKQTLQSLPLRISTSSILRRGSWKGAGLSLCRRSRNQKVPCVSLPTFFTQESRRGSGVRNPTKQKV